MIYLLTDGEKIKIGWTERALGKRVGEMQTGNVKTLIPLRKYLPGTKFHEDHFKKTFACCRIRRENGHWCEWFTMSESIAHDYFDLIHSFDSLDQHALDMIRHHFDPDVVEEGVLKARRSQKPCLYCGEKLHIKCGLKRVTVQGWPKKSPCCSRKIRETSHGKYCSRCRKRMYQTTVRKTHLHILDEPPGYDGHFCSMNCSSKFGQKAAEYGFTLSDFSKTLTKKAS